jgi:ribosome assembly protein YihI (activator of Der GTPase)
MKAKSLSGLGGIAVFLVVAIATTALSIGTLNAHAQNTTTTPQASQNQTVDSQQIKGYLNQAIQALDSGNNTKALEQVDIAGDQLETMMGTGAGEDDDEDEEGEVEEGPREDVDEPGDVDTNDQEDTP